MIKFYSLKCYLFSKKQNWEQGFTLIELLVVIIIISVLSAVALPNFLKQVGKARETEAKNFLGTVTYAQQSYHFEKQVFADQVSRLGVGINSEYYTFPDPTTANSNIVLHQAQPINAADDQVRSYAAGVYYGAGDYSTTLCQSDSVSSAQAVADNSSGNCTEGIVIQ